MEAPHSETERMGNVQAQLKERIEEWKDKKEFKKTVAEQERERKRQRARGKKGRFSIDLDPDLAEYFVGDDAFATALQRVDLPRKADDGKKQAFSLKTSKKEQTNEEETKTPEEPADPMQRMLERAKQRIKDLLKHHPDLERACTNADVVRYIADADEDGVGVLSPEIYMELCAMLYQRFDLAFLRPGGRYAPEFRKAIKIKKQLISEQEEEMRSLEKALSDLKTGPSVEREGLKQNNAAEAAIMKDGQVELKRVLKAIEGEQETLKEKEADVERLKEEIDAMEEKLRAEVREVKQKLIQLEMQLHREKELHNEEVASAKALQRIDTGKSNHVWNESNKKQLSSSTSTLEDGEGSTSVKAGLNSGATLSNGSDAPRDGTEWDDYKGWGTVSPQVLRLREIEKRRRAQRQTAQTEGKKKWIGAIQDVMMVQQIAGNKDGMGVCEELESSQMEDSTENRQSGKRASTEQIPGAGRQMKSAVNKPAGRSPGGGPPPLYRLGSQITEEIVKVSRTNSRPSGLQKQNTFSAVLGGGAAGSMLYRRAGGPRPAGPNREDH